MGKRIIAPSILAANFLNLASEINWLDQSKADWLHIDIMDGVFVPNISFGFTIMKAIRKLTSKPFDTHLMIVEPDRYLSRFVESGADHITVHYEACIHLHRTLSTLKELKVKAGVAINPHTPISLLKDILELADIVLVMSVNPGFGGQKFIPNSLYKIEDLKKEIERNGYPTLIEVDGGIDETNAPSLYSAGADILVAGTSIFNAKDPEGVIRDLQSN